MAIHEPIRPAAYRTRWPFSRTDRPLTYKVGGSISAVRSSWGLTFMVMCWIMGVLGALARGSEARYLSGR